MSPGRSSFFAHLPLKAPLRILFKFDRSVVIFKTVFRGFPMRLKKDDKRLRILDLAVKVFAHMRDSLGPRSPK